MNSSFKKKFKKLDEYSSILKQKIFFKQKAIFNTFSFLNLILNSLELFLNKWSNINELNFL